jgi:hypothetical protein
MSNSDIAVHLNEPAQAVTKVRNWLSGQASLRAPGPASMWRRFSSFMADNYDRLTERGFSQSDIERLPVDELIACIREWVTKNR